MSGNRGRDAVRIAVTMALTGMLSACAGGNREPSEAQLEAEMVMPDAVAVQVDGIRNAKELGNDLLFGGQPTKEALQALAAQGYHTIVNMRGTEEMDWDEKALVESLGMKYVAIPMAYPIEEIPDAWVQEFDRLMKDPEAKPMLLHCSSGNRVGGLYGVWLAEKKGVGRARALDLAAAAGMTRMRPVVEERLGEH